MHSIKFRTFDVCIDSRYLEMRRFESILNAITVEHFRKKKTTTMVRSNQPNFQLILNVKSKQLKSQRSALVICTSYFSTFFSTTHCYKYEKFSNYHSNANWNIFACEINCRWRAVQKRCRHRGTATKLSMPIMRRGGQRMC